MVTYINVRVDGRKAVVIKPKETRKQFQERLLWATYKVNAGLDDRKWKAA